MVINKAENKQINLTINNVWPGINLHKREIKVPKKKVTFFFTKPII